VAEGLSARAGGLLATKIDRGEVSGVDVSGNRLANAPTFTFNGGVDATLASGRFGKVSLHPSLSYQSSQYFEVMNEPILNQKAYMLVDAHLDYETADGRITASAWVKNAANQFYFTSRIDLLAGYGYIYNHIGAPRTFGGTLGYKF
jgi:iron complex outermembrane receptor protein